jgi:hypothetical protein
VEDITMDPPDDGLARGHAEVDRLLERAKGGDLAACQVLAERLRGAGLVDLAEQLEPLCDPATARRIATLRDIAMYPDDPP